jgi:uncharacterized membrane protein YkoI
MFTVTIRFATALLLAAIFVGGTAQLASPAGETKKKEQPAKKKEQPKAPAWVGSIKVEKDLSSEELAKLAKISSTKAKKAAEKAVKGGEADDVELKVVNGYLVYVVEVEVEEGGREREYDVIIDAGNGKVLAKMEVDD